MLNVKCVIALLLLIKNLSIMHGFFPDIQSMLIKEGFAVQAEYLNKEIIPSVNEYSTSCTDCVIFHPSTTSAAINLLNLHIDNNNDSDVEIERQGLQ